MDTVFVSEEMSHGWAKTYMDTAKAGVNLLYPPETLVRLFKGDYVTGTK